MKRFNDTLRILEVLVALIASVALLIGGVGIMNMMLVSVAERVREIGVRFALGARRSDVTLQFTIEALLSSAGGGALGVLGGVAAALISGRLITRAMPSWVGVVSTGACVGAFATALIVGLVFGWLPARRAGDLDPVEAMRR